MEQENKDKITYRCDECGSTNVQIQAWVRPNQNHQSVSDCEDREYSWCADCHFGVEVTAYNSVVEPADNWWNDEATGEDKEVVSGLNDSDFDSEEKYNEACNAIWEQTSDEEKVALWIQIRYRHE